MSVVGHCHRLAKEAVDVSSKEKFKARLDESLSHLGKGKVSLPMTGELE